MGRPAVALALVCLSACARHEPPEPTPPAPREASSVTTLSGAVASADVAPSPSPAPSAPRSLAGKKVLHVGDSMVGGHFGLTRAFEGKLAEAGAKIVRHTKVSETLASFDKTPTLRDLLRTHDPDIVVITLGANDANVPHPEAYARNVDNIVRRVGDRECWWIGPPSVKNAPTASGPSANMSIVTVLREHAGPCRFFDSSTLELERTSDGIHPNDRGAARWASAFWEAFKAPEPP